MSYTQILAVFIFAALVLIVFAIFRRLSRQHGSWKALLTENSRGIWTIAVSLLIIGIFVSAITATGSNVLWDFFKPGISIKNASQDVQNFDVNIRDLRLVEFYLNKWRALIQAAIVLAGLPIAYMLWHWRDQNVRDQIENARKDILLKEFLEVQQRAAGALDKTLEPAGVEALQIASLHQLRIFLGTKSRGTFQRPAFELLLAGHTKAMDELKTGQLEAIPVARRNGRRAYAIKDPQPFVDALENDRITRERMGILRDEVKVLFQSDVQLNGRNFDLLDLNIAKSQNILELTGSSFFGSNLTKSDLSSIDFSKCRLQATDLRGTNWRKAYSYNQAYFDHYTQLNDDASIAWSSISAEEKKTLRQELVNLGAIYRSLPRRRNTSR